MLSFFEGYRKKIESCLETLLAEKGKRLGKIDAMGEEACARLLGFIKKGKMLRGSLVFLGYELYRGEPDDNVAGLASACEIIQSGLLVHDDIMDRDALRRGDKSVYRQYADEAESSGISDALHTGEALGICIGDLAFFLAFGLLSGLELPAETLSIINGLVAGEIASVTIAQMLDVRRGASGEHAAEESVMRLYKHKTGRYTFSLPLAIGAQAGGAGSEARALIEEIGELLGVMFQIKDDELGLFGDSRDTGKPSGSDIKEGKNTLYSFYLAHHTTGEDNSFIRRVFESRRLTRKDMARIREIVNRYGISRLINQRVEEYSCLAREKLGRLEVKNTDAKKRLYDLIDFNLKRTS